MTKSWAGKQSTRQPPKPFLNKVTLWLEKIDGLRDKALFHIIKQYWPKSVTPNHLTIARIGIGAVLFIILFYYRNTNTALIVSLFCIGALTDLFDGSVARILDKKTKLGAVLDSVADRILIIPIGVYSLLGYYPWLLFTILTLEIINAAISFFGQRKNIFNGSNIFGKIKMVLQSLSLGAILVFWPEAPHLFFIYALWASAGITVISIFVKILELKETFDYGKKN